MPVGMGGGWEYDPYSGQYSKVEPDSGHTVGSAPTYIAAMERHKQAAAEAQSMRENYPAAWAAMQAGQTPTADMFDDTPKPTDTVAEAQRKQRNRRRRKRRRAQMAALADEQARMMQLVVFGGVGVVLIAGIAFAVYKWA